MDFQQKVQGIMYGGAVGDAIGLITETLTTEEAKDKPIEFPYFESIRKFTVCDWTDETDQHIIVMDTLRECISGKKLNNYSNRKFKDEDIHSLRLHTDSNNRHFESKSLAPINLFAYRLKQWATEGFRDLGDTMGKGCEQIVFQMTTRQGYIKNPIGISKNIWRTRNHPATNSCLARTPIIGVLDDYNVCIKLTERFCAATHPDPRNIAACVIIVFLVHTFTHHEVPREKIEDIIMIALEKGKMYLSKKQANQLDKYCYNDLNKFNLDKPGLTDFVFRALGCGIWALRFYARAKSRKHIFKRIIIKIIRFGGDSDCNASVAGSLLGSIGLSKIPKKWIKSLPNKKWMDDLIDKLVGAYNGNDDSESSSESDHQEPDYSDDSDESDYESDTESD